MTKRRMVFMLVLCSSMALLTVQALSHARGSSRSTRASDAERRRKIGEAEKRRESAERRRQLNQKKKELAEEGRGPLIDRETKRKKVAERRREFFWQKSALGATEEQWKVIKAKLEKVRQLSKQTNSAVGVSLVSDRARGAGARANVPVWQWNRPWEGKAPDELTEAQRLAKQLIALVERNSTTPQAFRLKMDALRKARTEESEIEKQLTETRRELREMLTPRQEAVLALMKWL